MQHYLNGWNLNPRLLKNNLLYWKLDENKPLSSAGTCGFI